MKKKAIILKRDIQLEHKYLKGQRIKVGPKDYAWLVPRYAYEIDSNFNSVEPKSEAKPRQTPRRTIVTKDPQVKSDE